MIFNGIENSNVVVAAGRERPFFAPLQRNYRGFENLIGTERGTRKISVPVGIRYRSLSDVERIKEGIAGWLVYDEPKILEFKDDPDRFYHAVVDDTINNGFLYNKSTEATISFFCGYKYSHERTITINPTATKLIEGHKSTPWKSKTTFTANQTGYELQFNNPGKTALRDINIIKLNYNFIKGDVLQINYSKRLITLNGNDITNTVSILQSNFMELPIGQVEFVANHRTEFYYNERYY